MRKAAKLLPFFAIVIAMALPVSASQFLDVPFDEMVRGTSAVVRGTIVGPVTSAWDESGEVIYSYANLRVDEYVTGSGPAMIRLREVGGTVAGYTQQAIGFPVLRQGEDVVLLLSNWEDSGDYRIHGYARGKFLVRDSDRGMMLQLDREPQGHRGSTNARVGETAADFSMDEFRQMVRSIARGGINTPIRNR